ncbi:MAG TPA: PSD1 and planctomycete cytochrome C domain-containing protein [Humisphaera sp.]|jgi:hypothetical protein|nr:PSD1 and planctomycete cytochrome C domain-containing protein [Humisphaera sp.]
MGSFEKEAIVQEHLVREVPSGFARGGGSSADRNIGDAPIRRFSYLRRFVQFPIWIIAIHCPVLVLIWVLLAAPSARAAVDFNRDVRPILAGNCLKCHGLDESARKSKLRLDLRETATGPAKSGKAAIVSGKPDESELVRRITSSDPDVVMPPASTHVVLSTSQKELLRQWVAEGAPYAAHWAFVAPKQAALPAVRQADWPRNPLDYFVLANLESQSLQPSPPADRYTLIRRLYLDLIGLPPTPRQADDFANDASPDAYEKLVDQLLASPRYGERWARRWLDLARYADTNGFEKDRPRTIWPWRDWVINALNADMPFDQFTIEQLAGDMLPNATQSQKIATGFHRNTMLNEEGGIDPLEYRFYSSIDRINTTGTTWLGLTVGCAQCHTHKYDPITQKEYYSLLAFLDNADEPQLEIPASDIESRRHDVEAKVAALTTALPDKFPGGATALAQAFDAWENQASARAVHWTPLHPRSVQSSKPYLTVLPDDSILAGGDIAKTVTYDLTFDAPAGAKAIRLDVLPDDSLPGHGPGLVFYELERGDFFLSELSVKSDATSIKLEKASQTFGSPAKDAIDGDPLTGWRVTGGTGKPHAAVFCFESPLSEARPLSIHMLFERYAAAPLGRFRFSVTTESHAAEPQALPIEIEAILCVLPADRSNEQRHQLFDYFLSIAPQLATARKPIDALRATMPAPLTTLVLRERPPGHARETYVHHRGEYLSATDRVEPGIPAFLPQLPPGATANRLAFARWLVSPRNPLTARVQMNRQWAAFFGRGIVRTVQDFGYQGEPPSDQALLDWLAVEFMKQGWSLKKLDRLIVTSAAYRQSSRVTSDLLARDPQNVLLSRGPRFRLEAEMIRDGALASSGLLSGKIGGPSVFPPQRASITTEGAYGALQWNTSIGEDRCRRSLYTFSKRTAPFALYNTFDAPSGEACIARRDVSNNPLQALSLLNDAVFIEPAQAMGKMLAESHDPDDVRATQIFRRFLIRPPDAEELAMLSGYAAKERARFNADQEAAIKVAGKDAGDVVERAVWTTVARAVMNLDETVTKD